MCTKKILILQILGCFLLNSLLHCQSWRYHFVVKEARYTRLCHTKKILTINGKFPGPTLYVHYGDTINVVVHNKGKDNITIHWHGVKQPRNPWTDGPEYITQCPIQPGAKFSQKLIFSDEEGTLWWHAHSDWSRATVHGLIVIYPKKGTPYPFPKPQAEVPIILGEWWTEDVSYILKELYRTGGDSIQSEAYTINGQPGDFFSCSKSGTFKINVDHGMTYLLRMLNAGMNELLFVAVAKHQMTVVGTDASYIKPLIVDYIVISPGQTIDVLLHANQPPDRYYLAARAYFSNVVTSDFFDNITTTAIVQYNGKPSSNPPFFPYLPFYNDTFAFLNFSRSLRSLAPINVPSVITHPLLIILAVNQNPCQANDSCVGPDNTRTVASMNNLTFTNPSIDILEAYYKQIPGVFEYGFPSFPDVVYNFTEEVVPIVFHRSKIARKVTLLDYNSTVEIVFQGANMGSAIDHPMHLHGYSFYVLGHGLGAFDKNTDPLTYNLIDPPLRNIVVVPINGWATVRFTANNPGVWFMHCHVERHVTWGMNTVFIVKDGKDPEARMLPPPSYMPPC